MAVDFKSILEEEKRITYEEIAKYLPDREPKGHYDAVREYPLRQGKALRPALLLLACEAFGGDPRKAIKTAAAMQTSEDWLLIHDDWEDDSEERRGKPALHKLVGNEIAINAGDALHIIQWRIMSDNIGFLDNHTVKRLFDTMYNFLMITAEGQFIEIETIKKNKIDFTEEDFYRIVDGKAAWYSIIGPIQLGAIIAGADDATLEKIADFGLPAGRAFQIQDDVLNLIGDPKKYGKEIGGDILEGKRTLILVHLIRSCTPEEKERIAAIYSKPRQQKTEQEKEYVLNLM
ncbi:MAG: polyprenyl synthetase family protein, partial [Candidatus Micrarchaeia archaeon]